MDLFFIICGLVVTFPFAHFDFYIYLRSTSTFKNPSWLILAEKWSYIVVANKAIDIYDHLVGKYFVVI